MIKNFVKLFLYLSSISVFSQVELIADFDVIKTSGCAPFIADFIDISSGGSSWNWDFGNGSSSNKQNPTCIYSQPGFYSISLTVTDSTGSDTETKSSIIRVIPPPTPNFKVNDETGCSPHIANFTDLSIPSSGTITNWFWAFGNGETSNKQYPSTIYKEIKDFDVFLKITDGNGCEASLSKSNYIQLDGPEAKFIFDSVVCGTPANVTFLNQSKGNNLDYLWDFGDGTSSTGNVPGTHTYDTFDSTEVTLIITEKKTGCSDTSTSSLIIGNYEAKFDWDIICGKNEFTINVENTTEVFNSLEWDFSGESKSYISKSSHKFSNKGPYKITLKSTIDPSCWDTTSIEYNLPIPKISINTAFCSYPFEVSFNNQSLGDKFNSYWEFGDSTFSNEKNPVHIYDIPPEEFLPKLIIEDSFGCTDSIQRYVRVPFPIARFQEVNSQYSGCVPLNLKFKDTSYTIGSEISSVKWDFGDPSSGNDNYSADSMPSHIYKEPGNYTIKYMIFTTEGCSDTAIYEAVIKAGEKPANASFEQLSNDSICYGESIQFIESASYTKSWIESNYYCWAFEEKSDSLLANAQSPPLECPENPEYYNTNKAFINFSQPTHQYSEFNHRADTNSQNISTGKILPSAGNLFTHLFIGYNNCLSEVIKPTFVDTTIAVNGYIKSDSLELFSDSSIQIGLYQASLNYDSIAFSYVYSNSSADTLIKIHHQDTVFYELVEGKTYSIKTKIINQISGCSNEIIDIFPIDSVRLNFDLSDRKCLDQNPVLFADNSFAKLGKFHIRRWLVNDSLVAFGKGYNPLDSFYYSFPDTGLFRVTLELINTIQYKKYGQWKTGYYTKSLSKKIKIEGIKARGHSDTLKTCSGNEIKFISTSKSTTEIKEYEWLFGDKTESNSSQNPPHKYSTNGKFIPILKVNDTFGCLDSISLDEIEVFNPVIDFVVSDSLICIGDIISIENKSIGESLSFTWTVDSIVQFSRSINQQFNNPGFYDIKLHATDTFNCKDSLTKTNFIEVSDIPEAGFIADRLYISCPPLTCRFSDTTSGNIKEWLWDFGDGNSRTDKNPTHIFTKTGFYDISLTVTNYASCRNISLKNKHIEIGGPSGEINFNKDTLCIPEAIIFNLNLNKTQYYALDFGDENRISNSYDENYKTINYDYKKGGIYKPTLELIDSFGCVYKLPELPKIYADSISSKFKTEASVICNLSNIKFDNNSRSNFESKFIWFFGNNDSSDLKSPIYTYSKGNKYDVTLKQISPLGCSDSIKKTITVFESPSPSIDIKNKNYCIPSQTTLTLLFENEQLSIDSIYFTINNSINLTGDSVVNIFKEEGEQQVQYTIKYASGNCVLDSTFKLSFYSWPVSNFEYSPGNSSIEQPVIFFTDKSINSTKWNWNFDDFESSSIQNPAHSYEVSNIYNVELITSNPGGCFDSITKNISVSPYDFIKLPSGFSPNGDGQNETFSILSAGNIELIEFKIFNRWGNVVFKTNDVNEAWDGKRRGKDQNAGTYIYYIKGQKNSGEITEIKGNFNLLR